jgi:hypothetical protein
MRPFHPRPLLFARASVPLVLLTALASGCGGAKSAEQGHPDTVGTVRAGDELTVQRPPAEEATFMRVGTFEPASAPSTMATAGPPPPPPLTEKKAGDAKLKQQTTAAAPTPTVAAERDKNSDPPGGSSSRKSGSIEGAVVDSTQGLSEADVRAAIAKSGSSFRRCYDLGLKTAPDFAGSVTMRVAISPAGNVASADVVTSNTNNQSVDVCVRDEVRKLVFKTTGSGAVVAFPIEFVR